MKKVWVRAIPWDKKIVTTALVTDFVTINGSISLNYNLKSADATMSIYSLSGKQLAQKSLTALTGSTNWSPNLAAGTYVFEIKDGIERIAKQIILQ